MDPRQLHSGMTIWTACNSVIPAGFARSQTPVWERIPGSSSFQTRAGNAAQPVLKGMKQELLSIGYPNRSLGTSTKLVTTYWEVTIIAFQFWNPSGLPSSPHLLCHRNPHIADYNGNSSFADMQQIRTIAQIRLEEIDRTQFFQEAWTCNSTIPELRFENQLNFETLSSGETNLYVMEHLPWKIST